jgi:hypothetical protein
MNKTYKCEMCEQEFESTWSDEEAAQELKDNFGDGWKIEDCSVICDDCYKKLGGPTLIEGEVHHEHG